MNMYFLKSLECELLRFVLLWLAACVYMLCVAVSVVVVAILMVHFADLVVLSMLFQEQMLLQWYVSTEVHNRLPCWRRVPLRKFSVLERWNVDQKQKKKSTSVVLTCYTWQIVNRSCSSQWQGSCGIKTFFFLKKFLAVSTKVITISLRILQSLSHKSNSDIKHFLGRL